MSERIRIGLDLRSGHEGWLGGLFYLQNLILATQKLDAGERPELLGLFPADREDLRIDVFANLLELRPYRAGDQDGSTRAKTRKWIKPLSSSRSEVPWGAGRAAAKYAAHVLFPTWKSRSSRDTTHLPWVPDLQHLHYPENFSRRERYSRDRAFRRIARIANLIVVSSEAAAGDFAARYTGTEDKLRILRFTTVLADDDFDRNPADVATRYQLPAKYLLFPGQFWRHKNHRLAFEAVRILRDRAVDVCLVCTGKTDDYRWPGHVAELSRYLDENRLDSHVRILGVVPRNDYVQLLRGAAAVVQSSLFEGWNSVVEDARAVGRPLVLSDIDVHLEQRPDGAVYFPRHDTSALADAIIEVLESPDRGNHVEARRLQLDRVRQYGRTFSSIAHEAAATRYN